MGSPAVAGVVAFAATLVLTPLFRRGARRFGFLDRPAERSSHTGSFPGREARPSSWPSACPGPRAFALVGEAGRGGAPRRGSRAGRGGPL